MPMQGLVKLRRELSGHRRGFLEHCSLSMRFYIYQKIVSFISSQGTQYYKLFQAPTEQEGPFFQKRGKGIHISFDGSESD